MTVLRGYVKSMNKYILYAHTQTHLELVEKYLARAVCILPQADDLIDAGQANTLLKIGSCVCRVAPDIAISVSTKEPTEGRIYIYGGRGGGGGN